MGSIVNLARQANGHAAVVVGQSLAANPVKAAPAVHERVYVAPKAPVGETAEQELARLRAENEALKQTKTANKLGFKVSDKGAVSVYGLGKWPVTLYGEQWDRLIESVPALKAFIAANRSKLSTK